MPPCSVLAISGIDQAVIGLYAAILLASGIWLARKPEDANSYFLANRRMPAWAVAISTLATALSAATFVAAPDKAYGSDLTYLIASIGGIIAAVIVAFVFLPVMYAKGVTTVYELLGGRFGPGAQRTGSAMFLLGRVCASGARVYIAAHALAYIMNGSITDAGLVASVWMLVGVGIVYTVFGGIATVIWTDVIQTVVFLLAVLVAVIYLAMNLGTDFNGALQTLRTAEGGSKLHLLSTSLDPKETYTLWTAIFGFTLLNIGAYGTDQDLAQRLLTCKSKKHAAGSLIAAVVCGLPITALFMLFGLLLYVRDVSHAGGPSTGESTDGGIHAMMRFITGDLPAGVGGLMIAGLFASGLSSLDSALNAMSSAFINDLASPATGADSERRTLRRARTGVVVSGIVLGLFASACVFIRDSESQSLIDFALSVMLFAYAGLVGVFACALLTRRGNSISAVTAMLAGLAIILGFQIIPKDLMPEVLAKLAFPWQMVLGAAVSFAICSLSPPSSPGSPGSRERPAHPERTGDHNAPKRVS